VCAPRAVKAQPRLVAVLPSLNHVHACLPSPATLCVACVHSRDCLACYLCSRTGYEGGPVYIALVTRVNEYTILPVLHVNGSNIDTVLVVPQASDAESPSSSSFSFSAMAAGAGGKTLIAINGAGFVGACHLPLLLWSNGACRIE
jgi:hypothetical protein